MADGIFRIDPWLGSITVSLFFFISSFLWSFFMIFFCLRLVVMWRLLMGGRRWRHLSSFLKRTARPGGVVNDDSHFIVKCWTSSTLKWRSIPSSPLTFNWISFNFNWRLDEGSIFRVERSFVFYSRRSRFLVILLTNLGLLASKFRRFWLSWARTAFKLPPGCLWRWAKGSISRVVQSEIIFRKLNLNLVVIKNYSLIRNSLWPNERVSSGALISVR